MRTINRLASSVALLVIIAFGVVVARTVMIDARMVRLHANWNGGAATLVQWGIDGAVNTVVDHEHYVGDSYTNAADGVGQFDKLVPYQSGHRYTIRVIPAQLGGASCSIVVVDGARLAYDSGYHRGVICTVPMKV